MSRPCLADNLSILTVFIEAPSPGWFYFLVHGEKGQAEWRNFHTEAAGPQWTAVKNKNGVF